MDRYRVDEGTTQDIPFTLRDASGVVVPLASIVTATLTLYDMDTADLGASPSIGVLNGRHGQDVKNANDVTIAATSGLVTWESQAEDNAIVTERRQIERHRALFTFVLSDASIRIYECEIEVRAVAN